MNSRSREGAWIEITLAGHWSAKQNVAPARERGLKSGDTFTMDCTLCRSREGAWIEITAFGVANNTSSSLPRGSVD